MQTVSDTLLITLGCSWTYGVGVCYEEDMNRQEFLIYAQDSNICDQLSFRGILAKQFSWDIINFSSGGSSNQRQFRLLKEFLISDQAENAKKHYKTIIVIHGITSTSRNEMYFVDEQKYVTWYYGDNNHIDKNRFFINHFYDHDVEVAKLQDEMLFYNSYYLAKGFNNIWFDTFNHHNYARSIDRMVGKDDKHRDILSQMCLHSGLDDFDDRYHQSQWIADSNRVKHLVRQGYLNPFSKHPTRRGHIFIADILSKELKKQLGPDLHPNNLGGKIEKT
jgi:hypothetical protein